MSTQDYYVGPEKEFVIELSDSYTIKTVFLGYKVLSELSACRVGETYIYTGDDGGPLST